jgi:hypothetical protein
MLPKVLPTLEVFARESVEEVIVKLEVGKKAVKRKGRELEAERESTCNSAHCPLPNMAWSGSPCADFPLLLATQKLY